jgi:hypothetical protein
MSVSRSGNYQHSNFSNYCEVVGFRTLRVIRVLLILEITISEIVISIFRIVVRYRTGSLTTFQELLFAVANWAVNHEGDDTLSSTNLAALIRAFVK